MQHYVITIFALFCILHEKTLRNILSLMGRKKHLEKQGLMGQNHVLIYFISAAAATVVCFTRLGTCAVHGEAVKLKQPEEGAFSPKEGSLDKLCSRDGLTKFKILAILFSFFPHGDFRGPKFFKHLKSISFSQNIKIQIS